MKVLSIDWDYFQNVSVDTLQSCYPDGVDLPSAVTEITWGSHYAANGEKLRSEVTIIQNEYERLMKILLNQNGSVPVLIVNSHVRAYDFIHKHLQDKREYDLGHLNEKVELINVDMHHDYINDSENLDCGNWIGRLIKDDILKSNTLGWIHNPVSFEIYGIDPNGKDDFSKLLRRLDKGTTLESIENEQFDLIVLARSDTWSAPHLDKYFCLLVNMMKIHFENVSYENGIDKPRMKYLKYAITMRDMYISIQRKGSEPA